MHWQQDRQRQDPGLFVRSILRCMCDERILSWRRDRRMQLKLVASWRRASAYGTSGCTTELSFRSTSHSAIKNDLKLGARVIATSWQMQQLVELWRRANSTKCTTTSTIYSSHYQPTRAQSEDCHSTTHGAMALNIASLHGQQDQRRIRDYQELRGQSDHLLKRCTALAARFDLQANQMQI